VIALCRLFEEAILGNPLYLFLPLLLSGAFTAFVLAVRWLVGLCSDFDQRFQQHQSISKGAPR
jgi:hypothetical protein